MRVLQTEDDAQGNDGKAKADDPAVDDAENLDEAAVLVMVEAEGLESRFEAVTDVETDQGEENQVAEDNVPDTELLTGHVVEVGLEFHICEGFFQRFAVRCADVADPLHVLAEVVGVGRDGEQGRLGFVGEFDFRIVHGDLKRFGLGHVSALNKVQFDKVEVVEVEDDADKNQAAGDHGQFGSFGCFRLRGLVVANRTLFAVADPDVGGQADVQQETSQQDNFEHLDEDVGAHEVGEGAIGIAAVFGQDKQVGRHVE